MPSEGAPGVSSLARPADRLHVEGAAWGPSLDFLLSRDKPMLPHQPLQRQPSWEAATLAVDRNETGRGTPALSGSTPLSTAPRGSEPPRPPSSGPACGCSAPAGGTCPPPPAATPSARSSPE